MCLILFYDALGPIRHGLQDLPETDRAAFTWDTSRFHEADAVVFQLSTTGLMRPSHRRAGQIWVLWPREKLDADLQAIGPEMLRVFDLTMSFNRNADVWYNHIPSRRAWATALAAPSPVKLEAAPAVLFLSSDRNSSGRLGYLTELMKHLRIDSFGTVLNNRQRTDRRDFNEKTIGQYRFCIAAEDAICDDYVTEALYRPLLAGTVPIYLGARNVEAFLPGDDCVIDVRSFAGPRRLAEHVSMLAQDADAYQRHLLWRTKPFRPAFERDLDHPSPLAALLDAVRVKLRTGTRSGSTSINWAIDPSVARPPAGPTVSAVVHRWLVERRDPFAAIWTDTARERLFRLLTRVIAISEGCGAALFLFGETLLGHIRQGGHLPWADHLDLVWCPAVPDEVERLRSAMVHAGLRIQDQDWLAISDPANDLYLGNTETKPILRLHMVPPTAGEPERTLCELVLPGRPTRFGDTHLWEPEAPLALLDWQYGNWRAFEAASGRTRPIVTNSRGRKDLAATARLRPVSALAGLRRSWQLSHAGAFAPVRDAPSLERQRRLLLRVTTAAERCGIRLFLFWGTLIGHVREGRILPWDDDLDLAFFDPGENQHARLRQALHEDGLRTHDHEAFGETMKVYDPTYEARTGHPWTWPMIDMFPHPVVPSASEAARSDYPVPRDLVLPGRPVSFEGSSLWAPEHPLALLDLHYPGWRCVELSSPYNHRFETPNWPIMSRRITTDASGRKRGPGPNR